MAKLLLIGYGNMGRAMVSASIASTTTVVEPNEALRAMAKVNGTTAVPSPQDLPDDYAPDIILLAVKPQIIAQILPVYARFSSACFVSVAAGTTLKTLADGLGDAAILRVMPNTPAAIGKGVFGLYGNGLVTANQMAMVKDLLSECGVVLEVENETQIDMITAISGSGPAYVFHMIEALSEAGKALGLPDGIARVAARQTVIGAAALAEDADEDAGQLRANVTSPNGTTAAALGILMGDGRLIALLSKTARAAFERAQELARST